MQHSSNKILSVIVVTCRAGNYLFSCLESLKRQSYPAFEIIVIDNSLNSNPIPEIRKYYPGIKLYSSPENLFYCGALNKGINISGGDFVLCLNDDVILDNAFIERAISAFNIDAKIGMVSGKVLRSDGKTIDSTGLFLNCFRAAKERGYGHKDNGRYEKEQCVFGVTGAAAFYRRKMLEDIKIDSDYFDTDFRFFYEDLDTAWRAQNSGWRAYYVPGAIAYHARGGSARGVSGIDKPYARRYLRDGLHADLIKNRYLTLIKNESFSSFLLHLPFILLYDFLAYGYVLIFRPRLIKKILLNFKYVNSAFSKRIIIKKKRKLRREHGE